MMKHLIVLALTVILFVLPAAAGASIGDMRVSLLEGDVQVRPADTNDWVPTSVNMPVLEGDSIWVPEDGRVEIQTRGGAYIRMNEATAADAVRIQDDVAQFYVSGGQIFVNNKGRKGDVIQVDTPNSSVRTYDKAIFRVDVREGEGAVIWVYRGVVYAEGPAGKKRVPAGKTLSIAEDGSTDLYPLGRTDDWERWNLARDRDLGDRLYSANYLPEELDAYAADFDRNGRWVNVTDYGYVWTPTVVEAGWAPYRVGRWVWLGGDYVWISYEPWGWAPYHYGRWAFVGSIGWCWVPPARGSVYWGPGYVGWVHTPTAVAWVPLAPGDVYYGYGYYGPNSVNIVNVNIRKVIVKDYRNVHVRNAVTVIDNDHFIHGPARGKVVPAPRENPFAMMGATIGRPQIKHERSIFMPVVKEVPKAKLPPARLFTQPEVKFRELRETRPVVKEPRGSIFTPSSPARIAPQKEKREIPYVAPSPAAPAVKRPETERRVFPSEKYRRPETDRGPSAPKQRIEPAPRMTPSTPPPAAPSGRHEGERKVIQPGGGQEKRIMQPQGGTPEKRMIQPQGGVQERRVIQPQGGGQEKVQPFKGTREVVPAKPAPAQRGKEVEVQGGKKGGDEGGEKKEGGRK